MLHPRRIGTDEVLMVGCDYLNDLHPARRFGWRTWCITADAPPQPNEGTWADLARSLGLPEWPAEVESTTACTS